MGTPEKPDKPRGAAKSNPDAGQPKEAGRGSMADRPQALDFLQALSEPMNTAVFLIQEDRFIYLNPAGGRLLGYCLADLADFSFRDLVHPKHKALIKKRLDMKGPPAEASRNFHFKISAQRGESWAEFTGSILSFQNKPALLASALDISQAGEAEDQLRILEERNSQIIDLLPDPTFAVDRKGRVIVWNKAMEKMSGIKARDMLGKANHEYSLVFWGERRPILIDLVMDWDESIEKLYPFVRREGDTLITEAFAPNLPDGGAHLWGRATVLHDCQGEIIGAIETVRDITFRMQLEESLRQSAEKHKTLIQSLPSGVITVNAKFQLTEINAQGQEILGRSQEEVLGRFCGNVLQSGACESGCPIKAAITSKKPQGPIETTIEHKEKGTVPISLRAVGLYDSAGQLTGGVEVFQDISAIKALERERANLVSMFAHDLKSPLVGIQGFALRMLKEDSASESQGKSKQYLEVIRKEAARLESIINDFLDFARLETGGLKLNFSATDLDKELMEMVEVFSPRFRQAGISLTLVYKEKLPIIQADALHLRRAFGNLLENALKYSDAGTEVTIDSEETENEVLVKVSDQGIGISAEELPFIFDMFYRAKEPGSRKGHGLGLAGVEAIIKGHNGRVLVASEVGKGSVFTVALPKDQPENSD
jgi:PAS domain S-box-containing protein